MGIEHPLLNFRVPLEIKDTLTLHANREGREVGPMVRGWVVERLAVERTLEVLKSVGLSEVLRRLSAPSLFMSNDTASRADCTEPTLENFVLQDRELVLHGVSSGPSVLQVRHGKRQ